ncbi:MAG: hypothetical protein U0797_23285 [Gemmataceae bacterium]
MSTAFPIPPAAPAEGRELVVVSHSPLFYWWPVWLVGFLMALMTYLGNHRMAIVPTGTVAASARQVEGFEGARDVLVVPAERHLPAVDDSHPRQPHVLMATSKNLGGLFVLVLVVVIIVTNVPLRGLWSGMVILAAVILSLFLALMDWWDPILRFLGLLHIYINAFGYLAIAGFLFVAWAVTTFLFDRRVYMVFSPGQFRVHLEIGTGETAYDTLGMVVQKKQDDLFRHWILGMGSGDLVVTTGGATTQTFEIPNVVFIGQKIRVIEQMLQEREVVHGQMEALTAS